MRKLDVRAGRVLRVEIAPTVTVKCRGHAAGDGRFAVRMHIEGDQRSGLSVYRQGRRIPARYAICDSAGKLLDRGDMAYG